MTHPRTPAMPPVAGREGEVRWAVIRCGKGRGGGVVQSTWANQEDAHAEALHLSRTTRCSYVVDPCSRHTPVLSDPAADELTQLRQENARLRALLRQADNVVIWEHTYAPEGFQEQIERELGVEAALTPAVEPGSEGRG